MNSRLKHALVPLLMVAAPCFSMAQQGGAQPPVKGMASTVGLYVYPQKKQSATQQLTDEQQCYNGAQTQTGYDPNATAPAPKTKGQKGGNDDHDVAKGAARGAVISGAKGGDAAAGARRGAIIGGIRSKREKKKDDEAKQQTEAKKTARDKKQDDFKRAVSACLDARGYSVR
ncbi:MAG: hypothetical protein QOJ51_7039 [Acidobacteriaceae bacterium]|nr:hypothetical protein [Acidobacteriaceae bacterium]MEA2264214.1 hypothetical protein [Acidobacteriaceae bacterium]